ncbi:protein-disulfide reductase DsbD [Bdellovibrio sp. SKB1291214]|uniref:protein-disulfide reductase DsbD family protein n=1 Tax=Bdellovibrio sp. SKB1291214 TaxID=1732569 RepID=UPI000B51B91A|nr:protein-disulfide reductase DsbD [Bdellovibrio sp. SKB1291214]UYL10002.1 protein-disulfide reductase DsbD [Bdellovibrio sp. SKB1291214]
MKATLQNLFIIVSFLVAGLTSWAQTTASEKDPLLVETQVLPYEWSPGQGGSITFKLKLPENYHAYEDQFKVVIYEPDGFKVAPFKLEPVTKWHDKFSKRERTGLVGEGTLTAHIEAPTRFLKKYDKMKLELTYQACSDQFCLFPTTKTLEVPIVTPMVEGTATLQGPTGTADKPNGFFDSANFAKYLGSSMVAGLIFVFLAGIFTSFTPCIFPMIPITLAVLGNHSEERTRLQNFLTSCVYVLGIATTYSLLGLVAASSGNMFGASLGNPYVLTVVCVIFLTMALSMYGLFELQVPAFLRNKIGNKKNKQTIFGIYLTGLFAGIVASPCVGPVLVAILTYVASTKNMLYGFLFLFFYALGLGLIFIVLGLSNQLVKSLPRSGPWMVWFKFILGTLMLSAFYYYLELLLPVRWFDGSLGIGLVIIASIYGAFLPAKGGGPRKHMQKGIMQAVLIVGIGYVVLSVFDLRPYIRGRVMADNSINQIQMLDWKPYSAAAIAQAAKEGRPVMIDFWAEWCAACHELEENTFTDPRVRAMAANFTLLKFDATKESPELKELKKKYNIQGLPTVIFYNPKGVWIDGLTLTQFEKADKFLQRLEKAAQ